MGRVLETRATDGTITRMVYDGLGRRVMTIGNYASNGDNPALWEWDDADEQWEESDGTAIDHNTDNDQNLISLTVYNNAGQVISSRDARGTVTGFVYDDAGRRVSGVQAVDTHLETRNYTCFDKAGRVLRTIQNYLANTTSPDTWTNGAWDFQPDVHGQHQDRNIIQSQTYDASSRVIERTDAENNSVSTAYNLNGTVDSMIDAAGVITAYRYDALRRRLKVVQNHSDNGEDPALWTWDSGDSQYEESDGTAILHGTDNDENIIVQLTYDLKGRMTHMRDPRGHITSYAYDALGRRVSLTNPLNKVWETLYADNGHVAETTMTYPGLSTGGSYDVTRKTDRMGRMAEIDYGAAATTPTVSFGYDLTGNRNRMTENDGTSDVRITDYAYDAARRLTQVDIDSDADATIDETVSYDYDLVGRRTTLTMPGNQSIAYEYDAKGRLIAMSDWDSQVSHFAYDAAGRHIRTQRPNSMTTRYGYDSAGRLRQLKHSNDDTTLLGFEYQVDSRGNRTQAVEILDKGSYGTVTYAYNAPELDLDGTWTDASSFKVTDNWDASLRLLVTGDKLTLTYGVGPDHSIFDVYIGGTLYNSYNGYNPVKDEKTLEIDLAGDGLVLFEMKNRADNSPASDGYRMRFKSLAARSRLMHRTIDYTYDALQRLLAADYSDDRSYAYSHDVAGNRTQQQVTIGMTTTTTDWTYNVANQMTTMQIGSNPLINFTFDDNGNLTDDGAMTYSYDHANRLTTVNNGSYNTHFAYDGAGDRYQQTVGGTATAYLLDMQPGLSVVLQATTGTETLSYQHSPMGVFAVDDGTDWHWMGDDGLGTIRAQLDVNADVTATQSYDPYGLEFESTGTFMGDFGFAGEQIDSNGLSYNRARTYNPGLGIFTALDPFEGIEERPMSMNGYSYTEGNPTNWIDPAGEFVNVLGGVVLGSITGAILGYANAVTTYELGITGKCGCEMQKQLTDMGPGAYMKESLAMGILFGAAIGALISFPLAPILQTLLIVIGLAEIARLAGAIINDFLDNLQIDNWCNVAQLVIEIAGEAVVINHIDSVSNPSRSDTRRTQGTNPQNNTADYSPTADDYQQAQTMVDRHRQEARDTYGTNTIMQTNWIPYNKQVKLPLKSRHSAKHSNGFVHGDTTTVAEDWNTVIQDIDDINNGLGFTDGVNILINGRLYREKSHGEIFPISGNGFHQLDRIQTRILGVLNKKGEKSAQPFAQNMINKGIITNNQYQEVLTIWETAHK